MEVAKNAAMIWKKWEDPIFRLENCTVNYIIVWILLGTGTAYSDAYDVGIGRAVCRALVLLA